MLVTSNYPDEHELRLASVKPSFSAILQFQTPFLLYNPPAAGLEVEMHDISLGINTHAHLSQLNFHEKCHLASVKAHVHLHGRARLVPCWCKPGWLLQVVSSTE